MPSKLLSYCCNPIDELTFFAHFQSIHKLWKHGNCSWPYFSCFSVTFVYNRHDKQFAFLSACVGVKNNICSFINEFWKWQFCVSSKKKKTGQIKADYFQHTQSGAYHAIDPGIENEHKLNFFQSIKLFRPPEPGDKLGDKIFRESSGRWREVYEDHEDLARKDKASTEQHSEELRLARDSIRFLRWVDY